MREDVGLIVEITKLSEKAKDAGHFYEFLLESCEKLFDNELEQVVFEDQMRYMFGIKVCTTIKSEYRGDIRANGLLP